MRDQRKRLSVLSIDLLEDRHMLAGDAMDATGLQLRVRDTYSADIPILVRVQHHDDHGRVDRSSWNDVVTLATDNPDISLSENQVMLRNGMGSVLVAVSGAGPFSLIATLGEHRSAKELRRISEEPVMRISGEVGEGELDWSGLIHVTGDVTIPADTTLTIQPGTLVKLDGVPVGGIGTQINVHGQLHALGTEESPITFTATEPDHPWGQIYVQGGQASFSHTIITRAGNALRRGHTTTGPAIRLSQAGRVEMNSSSITDIRGKIMQSDSGEIVANDTLFSRAVMGPEIKNSGLHFKDSWILDMAGAYHPDGTVDDNDGIYLHSQEAGQDITLEGGVVGGTEDDGIDTLGSDVTVSDFIVRDIEDKAASIFHGSTSFIRTVISDADIGVNAKGVGSNVVNVSLNHVTIANVNTAIRAEDKGTPDPDVIVNYEIVNTIVHTHPNGDAVQTDYDPNHIRINYSLLPNSWTSEGSGTGNIVADPLFVDLEQRDYRLQELSPAVDAGDPDAEADPDGSRADMGTYAFQAGTFRGDFNDDGQINITDVDLLCTRIAATDGESRFDLTADGLVNEDDITTMIQEILDTVYGDVNLDSTFNSSDLVAVFRAGKYESAESNDATWSTGDWNCDGDFSTSDLVTVFTRGSYSRLARPVANEAAAALDFERFRSM